jgi:hypothetical protein
MELAIPLENRARLAEAAFAGLAAATANQRTIKHALEWLLAHTPPRTITDLVTQDEFSHDVLVDYQDGLWLAYDTT